MTPQEKISIIEKCTEEVMDGRKQHSKSAEYIRAWVKLGCVVGHDDAMDMIDEILKSGK